MKKILFAGAFALIGTFALANETNKKENEKKEETKSENVETLDIICMPVVLSCGIEDCFNYDNSYVMPISQFFLELAHQDNYVCIGG